VNEILKFELPNEKTPGYLRRLKVFADYQESQKAETSEIRRFEKLCAFLLTYVVEPADKDAAMGALLDASKEEIDELFALIGNRAEVPPEKGVS
jgi:hypothetical protein